MGHRRVGAIIAWLLCTVFAVAVAWLGVSQVLTAAAPDRAAAVDVVDLHRAPGPSPSAALLSPPRLGTPGRAPTVPSPATIPTTSTSASAGPPTPTVDPGAHGTTTAVPESCATSDGGQVCRYRTTGGTATFRFAPGDVRLVSATPGTGYAVTVERLRPDLVRVTFDSASRRSFMDAYWYDGPFVYRVES
jgi:hypothetical protein